MLRTKLTVSASGIGLAIGILLASSANAQTQAQATPAKTDAAQTVTVEPTITIFGKKRASGDRTRTKIDTTTGSSCGFSNPFNAANESIVEDYLDSFGQRDNDSNDAPGTDQTDPNAPGAHFKDTAPFGSASQDNGSTTNNATDGNADGRGMAASQFVAANPGGCTAADINAAAARNYILRKDHSLKDAFAAYDAGDYAKALPLFKTAYTKIGVDQAALMLGKMYLAGQGAPRDTTQAIFWFKKVAEARFAPEDIQSFDPAVPENLETRADAAMTLAKIYMVGWDVPKAPKEAIKWYAKAEEFGFIPAAHILGQIYQSGYGGEKSIDKAITYYKKAGSVGYAPSQYVLGTIYYEGTDGVAPDKKLAGAWLVAAAKQGHPDALYAVARMYDLGEGGVEPDPARALVYYKEAATKGQPDAEADLAIYFYNGEIVPKDLATARKLFEASAKQGNEDAMFNLAAMMANGQGGPKDMAMAYVWFTLADESGNDTAAQAVKEIAPKLTAEDKARADAVLNPKPAAK